jgi:uncharacterized membrane protein YjjP (DUF1212 family)
MNEFMTSVFGLNWRTTIAGIVGATAYIVNDYLNGKMDFKTFIIAFIVAAAGFVAKDAKTTGTALNPRAQLAGESNPNPTPAAEEKIAAIKAKQ